MATTNLFSRPVFKEGAFTANDPAVRRYAVAKALDAIDLGVELGATVFVLWGGREGVEAEAAKDVRGALDRYAEAVNLCCSYVRERNYDLRFALEPKPNEPRGDIFLPTVGHALAFIHELEWPEMVGVNPEFAHETMSGLSFTHAVAQALWQGKLFHIDLNAQRIGKFDQDFRFGSEGIRDAFYLVKLLEDAGWDGMRHFDAHPYRTEDTAGVWDFARGCMRNYLILREKVRHFRDDPEIAEALAVAGRQAIAEPTSPDGLGADAIDALRSSAGSLSEVELGGRGYGHERLDQLATELLLGIRPGH
jgi:xylose isomerase